MNQAQHTGTNELDFIVLRNGLDLITPIEDFARMNRELKNMVSGLSARIDAHRTLLDGIERDPRGKYDPKELVAMIADLEFLVAASLLREATLAATQVFVKKNGVVRDDFDTQFQATGIERSSLRARRTTRDQLPKLSEQIEALKAFAAAVQFDGQLKSLIEKLLDRSNLSIKDVISLVGTCG